MQTASWWIGGGSLVLATATGTVFAMVAVSSQQVSCVTTDNDRRWNYTWRAFTIERDDDEVTAQTCFDRHSGLTAVERDEDERAKVIFVEENGPLAACMQSGRTAPPRAVCPPSRMYFHHRVIDPWAPRNEPVLFPPVIWHRCGAVTPSHVVEKTDKRMAAVYADAEACIDTPDLMSVDLELTDGRVHRVSVDSIAYQMPHRNAAGEARVACIVRAMCRYRFEHPYEPLHLAVMSERTLKIEAPTERPVPEAATAPP